MTVAMAVATGTPPALRTRRSWLALAIFAVVFFTSRQVTSDAVAMFPTSWTDALLDKGSYFLAMALVALLLVAASRRVESWQSRRGALAAWWILLAVLSTPLFAAVLTVIRALPTGLEPPLAGWIGSWATHLRGASSTYLILVTCVLVGDWGFRTYDTFVRERVAAARLAQELEREQLAAVSMRLDPDFVLGAIASIRLRLASDPAAAEDLLLELSDLLRRVLESDPDGRWPLREELRFAAGYLHLATAGIRGGEQLPFHFDREAESAEVPTFLLRPWLESVVRLARLDPAARLIAESRSGALGSRLTLELALRAEEGTAIATNNDDRAAALAHIRERVATRHGDSVRFESPVDAGSVLAVRLSIVAEEEAKSEHAMAAGPSGEVIWKRA